MVRRGKTLEKKLQVEESNIKVSMKTNLQNFARILRHDYKTSKNKIKEQDLLRAYCMMGYLYEGKLIGTTYTTKPVHTVGDLYSYPQDIVSRMSGYREKTWTRLSKQLVKYGLPPLKLPRKWVQTP